MCISLYHTFFICTHTYPQICPHYSQYNSPFIYHQPLPNTFVAATLHTKLSTTTKSDHCITISYYRTKGFACRTLARPRYCAAINSISAVCASSRSVFSVIGNCIAISYYIKKPLRSHLWGFCLSFRFRFSFYPLDIK